MGFDYKYVLVCSITYNYIFSTDFFLIKQNSFKRNNFSIKRNNCII
jgi:hypothetical protein